MPSTFHLVLTVGRTATPEAVQFWILAPLAVAAALGILVVKKAVHSALLMAWVMITLAIFYIAQGALFLGIVQIVVYTGAVMMLFLFILMLVGVDGSESFVENLKGQRLPAIFAALGLGGLIASLLGRASVAIPAVGLTDANAQGNVQGLAKLLFTHYVWAFEVVSAHSQKIRSSFAQRDLSVARFRKDSLAEAAGLPAPGVYARHNAVDVPALLPDGSPAPTSVSQTLRSRGEILATSDFALKAIEEQED
jgi:NADH-quinone oxidoreductase subunit J